MKKGSKLVLSLLFLLLVAVIVNLLIDSPTVLALVVPTNTSTPVPPTNTPTVVPPTNTPTVMPPTNTPTPILPTSTPTELVIEPEVQRPANSSWEFSGEDSSTTFPMVIVPLPAPHPWEILLSEAIKLDLSTPVQLCHPFRGGQFGWTGAIYLRSGSSWIEIPSTTAWTPDEEGRLMICATAPMSGLYAIFGYAEPYEMETKNEVEEEGEPIENDLPTAFYVME